jgi:hypothetical protein
MSKVSHNEPISPKIKICTFKLMVDIFFFTKIKRKIQKKFLV